MPKKKPALRWLTRIQARDGEVFNFHVYAADVELARLGILNGTFRHPKTGEMIKVRDWAIGLSIVQDVKPIEGKLIVDRY